MRLLEFMQPFDGSQPEISEAEQLEATDLFTTIIRGALLNHVQHVRFLAQEVFGNGVPRLSLVSHGKDANIQEATIGITDHSKATYTSAHLYLPQNNDVMGKCTYTAEEPGIVTRHDIANLIEYEKMAKTGIEEIGVSDFATLRKTHIAVEQERGFNDCPVGPTEIRGLGALLVRMSPRQLP